LENIESQLPVVVRRSSTCHFKALEMLWFTNGKSMFTF